MKNQRFKVIQASLACTVLVFLVTVLTVYAADPYWMGHLWDAGYAKYKISSSVPGQYHDDIENAAAKWSAPSPFYFQKTTQEPLYVGGHLTFGDPPWWAVAYTDVWYSDSDSMRYFMVTFDADLPQGWTDAPCWQWWVSEYRVFSVALHELGHALDFTSVSDTDTVMYTNYRCYTDLYQRDRNAVDDLY